MNVDDGFTRAEKIRHHALELLKTAADMEAEARQHFATQRDGLGRLRCCGAGPDQRDPRTGEDLHLPYCTAVVSA